MSLRVDVCWLCQVIFPFISFSHPAASSRHLSTIFTGLPLLVVVVVELEISLHFTTYLSPQNKLKQSEGGSRANRIFFSLRTRNILWDSSIKYKYTLLYELKSISTSRAPRSPSISTGQGSMWCISVYWNIEYFSCVVLVSWQYFSVGLTFSLLQCCLTSWGPGPMLDVNSGLQHICWGRQRGGRAVKTLKPGWYIYCYFSGDYTHHSATIK